MAGVVHSRAVVCPSCSSCWFNYRQRHRRRNATTPCVESPFIGVLTAPLNRGEDDALAIGPVSTRVSATPSPRKRTPVMIDRSRGSVGAVHGDLTRVLAEGTLCIHDTNAPQNCYQFLLTVRLSCGDCCDPSCVLFAVHFTSLFYGCSKEMPGLTQHFDHDTVFGTVVQELASGIESCFFC